MIRHCLTVLVLVCAASPVQARSILAEQWLRVQQALASEDREAIEDRILEFQQLADDLAVRRMSPYAAALVMWAKDHPGPLGQSVVQRARLLDRELPSSYFLSARWQWQGREWIEALRSYLAGWWAVFLFEPSRHAFGTSVASWLLVVVGWTLGVAVVVQVLKFLRQLAHDAVEASSLLLAKPNAAVLGVLGLLLPLCIGLGPVWLIMYLFVLSWSYMEFVQRTTALVTCVALALIVPALAVERDVAMRTPSLVERVAIMLDERKADPSTLREFASLEPELEGVPSYHLVLGELVRMHGDADGARLQFQKAALQDDVNPAPLIFLGNLSMEEGDIQRAIQRYNAAIDLEPRAALAYHNLSSAYDQSRRFQEGDAAREMARTLTERRGVPPGIPGRDARIRFPRLGQAELAVLVAQAEPLVTLEDRQPLVEHDVVRELLQPTPRVFWILTAVGGLVLLVRRRWFWTAQTCSKCGKVFCPRCKSATESASYCSQCISVFLKRDVVSIDQQTAKLDQIRRWLLWSSVWRRVAGLLIPGSAHMLDGRVWLGLAASFLAWACLTGALIWAPVSLASVDPFLAALPIQVVAAVGFAILWLRSITVAWYRR